MNKQKLFKILYIAVGSLVGLILIWCIIYAAILLNAKTNLKVSQINYDIEVEQARAKARSISIINEQLSKSPSFLNWHRFLAIQAENELLKNPNYEDEILKLK